MRISDWSSDVCSSDLTLRLYAYARDYAAERGIILADTKFEFGTDADGRLYVMDEMLTPDSSRYWPADEYDVGSSPPRSEEHTSELQSLMRISYAVFCLKKKNTTNRNE